MATKAKRALAKRRSGKRDTVKVGTKTMYAKRTSGGRFMEMDEKGRSLKADRRVTAKTERALRVPLTLLASGQG